MNSERNRFAFPEGKRAPPNSKVTQGNSDISYRMITSSFSFSSLSYHVFQSVDVSVINASYSGVQTMRPSQAVLVRTAGLPVTCTYKTGADVNTEHTLVHH